MRIDYDRVVAVMNRVLETAERVGLETKAIGTPLGDLRVVRDEILESRDDICGLCGEPGADKIPHPVRWPGERSPDTELVHESCEDTECNRAHSLLSDNQRAIFLAGIW